MKKYLVLLVVLGVVVMNSCNKPKAYIDYHSNSAKFYVKNLRTNDSLFNDTLNSGISVFNNSLEIKRNDNLLLVYQAPDKYVDSKFTIRFQVFEEEYSVNDITGNQSYQSIAVVKASLVDSSYLIQCEAVSDEWIDGSYDKGYVMVRVTE